MSFLKEIKNVYNSGRFIVGIHPTDKTIYTCGYNGIMKKYINGDITGNCIELNDSTQVRDSAINDISFSVTNGYYCICDNDGEVTIFLHANNECDGTILQYQTGSVCVNFDYNSDYMISCCDDGDISILNSKNISQKYKFKGNKNGVRYVKFIRYDSDDEYKYFGVCGCDGNYSVYKIDKDIKEKSIEAVKVANFDNIFQKIKAKDELQSLTFDCNNNGLVALSGNNDIKMISVKDMKISYTLTGHNSVVNCVSFSSNDKYIASSDVNGSVCIWQSNDDKYKLLISKNNIANGHGICNLVWVNDEDKPYIVFSNNNGSLFEYRFLDDNIDEDIDLKDVKSTQLTDNDLLAAQEIFGNDDVNIDGFDDDSDTNKTETIILKQKSPKKGTIADVTQKMDTINDKISSIDIEAKDDDTGIANMIDDDLLDDNIVNEAKNEDNVYSNNDDMNMDIDTNNNDDNKIISYNNNNVYNLKEHNAFQNGETKFDDDNVRYLFYNEIGGVILRLSNNDNGLIGAYSYEIDFADKNKYRAVRFRYDKYYNIASLCKHGIFISNEAKIIDNNDDDIDLNEENNVNYSECFIRYKPFITNDLNAEWSQILNKNEYAITLGCSINYLAVATNLNYLRIFTLGGLQYKMMLLDGKAINISTSNDNNVFAITYDVNGSLFMEVIDMDTSTSIFDGKIALTSNEATLIRVFVSKKMIYIIDSNNILSLLKKDFSKFRWIPVLNINNALDIKYSTKKDIKPNHAWPVYYDNETNELIVIELNSLSEPIVSSESPIFTAYNLNPPLLNNGTSSYYDLETQIFNDNILHNSAINDDKKYKKELLKNYLKLFQNACELKRPMLAYDIALHKLNTQKALTNASKIAMHMNDSKLAQRINALLTKKYSNNTTTNNNNNEVLSQLDMNRKSNDESNTSNNLNIHITARITNNNSSNIYKTVTNIGKKRKKNKCNNSEEPSKKKKRKY